MGVISLGGGNSFGDEMRMVFSEAGLLSKSPDFEYRPEQQQMAGEVAEALQGERSLVIEAGTGVGKSLAYLIPAVEYAIREGKKAVISTHTINLQEQLIGKDLPIVRNLATQRSSQQHSARTAFSTPRHSADMCRGLSWCDSQTDMKLVSGFTCF